jgi:hypothetical protein
LGSRRKEGHYVKRETPGALTQIFWTHGPQDCRADAVTFCPKKRCARAGMWKLFTADRAVELPKTSYFVRRTSYFNRSVHPIANHPIADETSPDRAIGPIADD